MDKSYIGKTATIMDDPLDKGLEAIILDYHEADNTCDIKVLLPGDRKRIRKIHAECLAIMDNDIDPFEDPNEIVEQEKAWLEGKKELPNLKEYFKKHEPQVFDYANDPEFKRFIVKTIADVLAAYLTSGMTESVSNSKRTWHP